MRGVGALSRAMFLGFTRDRAAVFFTILFPLMFLVLFGGVFKNQSAPRAKVFEVGRVAVLEEMSSAARADLGRALEIVPTTDRDAALAGVRKGDYAGAIEQDASSVVVHYSAADQVKAATVQGIMSAVVQDANLAAAGRPATYTLAATQVEDASLQAIQYVTPGLLSWAVAMGATFGAAMTLVTWRQKKTLRRLRLSPVSTGAIALARLAVSVGVALVQTGIFIVVARMPYFGLKLSSAWWMTLPVVVCGTLAFLAVGMLAGARAKSPEAASAIANLIVLPMAFLSGSFFALDNAPGWLQAISKVLPLRYVVDGIKNVMVLGQGPASALPAMGILLAFAVVIGAVAVRLFRWEDA